MRIEELRKGALLWSIVEGYEQVTDRLLDAGVELPDVSGTFTISINGVPACVASSALLGYADANSECQFSSLHQCVKDRNQLKAAFPAGIVAINAGSCRARCSSDRAA